MRHSLPRDHLCRPGWHHPPVGKLLFPILIVRVSPFKEMLDWLQFAYTTERTGAYVVTASTVLVPSAVLEGYPLFTAIWRHLWRRFPGAYAPTPNTRDPPGLDDLGYPEVFPTLTTIVPLGTEYFD